MTGEELAARMDRVAARVEAELDALLPGPDGAAEARLYRAMRHSALGGGKRLRPFLTHAAAGLFGVDDVLWLRAGVAIEMVHTYSLIHDDLPAMDNAELRRGRPACHRAFDEATAILAGDALQALAFEVLARGDWPAAAGVRADLVAGLARAAGAAGMCGGQQIDLEAEGQDVDLAAITRLQQLKTGALIAFSLDAAHMLAASQGRAGPEDRAALAAYASDIGLAFQIRDDLLDISGDPLVVGKDLGRDEKSRKATFPSLMGEECATAALVELRDRGCAELDRFGDRSKVLRDLFDYVINRKL